MITLCNSLPLVTRIFTLWGVHIGCRYVALVPARMMELFPDSWPQCLPELLGPVSQACREQPLHYTPLATVLGAALLLMWCHGGCNSFVSRCWPGGRSVWLPVMVGVPQGCIVSQGDGAPETPESSHPDGLSVLGQFCLLILPP